MKREVSDKYLHIDRGWIDRYVFSSKLVLIYETWQSEKTVNFKAFVKQSSSMTSSVLERLCQMRCGWMYYIKREVSDKHLHIDRGWIVGDGLTKF